MSVPQSTRLARQLTVAQSVTYTSDKPLSTSSTDGTASQYPDSDSEQQTNFTFPVYPEEEVRVSGWEAGITEQDSDQQTSEGEK